MRITLSAESRELDRIAIEDFGLSGLVLMENAARSVAREALSFWPWLARPGRRITVLAGVGQNGGDGWVLARLLHSMGHRVECHLITQSGRLPVGDAAVNCGVLHRLGIRESVIHSDTSPLPDWSWPELVVDCVFGTGLDRPLDGQARRVLGSAARIKIANPDAFQVLAVDLPSGLSGDTGAASPEVLPADLTVSLGTMKLGLFLRRGPELAGEIRLGDIGLCPPMFTRGRPRGTLIDVRQAAAFLPARPTAGHKGIFGHAVVAGGSAGKTGALALAATGALRSGCGLVTAARASSLAGGLLGLPEAMTLALPESELGTGTPGLEASRTLWEFMNRSQSLGLGPGLGLGAGSAALALELGEGLPRPMVLDADALTHLAGRLEILLRAPAPRIITPHPGEAGRLLGLSSSEVEDDRPGASARLADVSGAVVVLKGRHTLIASPDGRYLVNSSGGPVMATGGSGDLLTGLLTGILAQGSDPFEAAGLAVFLHGLAGDLAVRDLGPRGVTVTEIAARLPRAWAEAEAAYPVVS